MLSGELVKRLQGFGKDADRVLIEFPKVGGPYYSPGDIVQGLEGDMIIETDYPRTDLTVRDFFIKLMQCPDDREVRLFLNQGGSHPIAYYNIGGIRIHERGIVLVAGDKI